MPLSGKIEHTQKLASSLRYSFGNNVKRKIFFLHVHKCGGTSIANSVSATYGVVDNALQRRFGNLVNEASVEAARTMGISDEAFRESLLLYYMARRKIKYISGHFGYSEKAMAQYGAQWDFITVLRDPVARWFSHYFMDKYQKEKSPYASIDEDLESFILSERSLWEARKYVLMFTDNLSLEEAASQPAIDQAIDNLKKFSLVGFLDRLDDFAEEYEQQFGVKLRIKKMNKNPLTQNQQQELISPEIRQKVMEICGPSMAVYEAVRNS